jgi:signal transduction histidine kinase
MLAAESTLIAQLPCAAVWLDGSSRIREANEALATMTGRPLDGLAGEPFESLFTPAGSAIYQSYVLPLLTLHGRIEEFALSLRTLHGGKCDVLLYASLVDDAAGRSTYAVLAPYRTRRLVDDELLKVKRAADESPAMIFELVREPDGRIAFTYLSRAVTALFGCTPQQAIADAQQVLGQLPPGDAARLHAHPPAQAEATHHFTVARPMAGHGQGQVWHEWQASSRRLSNGRVVWAGHVADVSGQEALRDEALALRAAEHARQAQTEFLGRVSHELRTPLNAILGFTQLLAHAAGQGASTLNQRHIELIGMAGQRLLHLIDDVLDLTSLRSSGFDARPTPVALAPLVAESLAILEQQARQSQVLMSADLPDNLWVEADRARLAQAIDNLLSNAIKYNRPDGTVRVSATVREGGVALDIVDTGIGLDDEQRRALFQPFNRLGAERGLVQGTGLGLVITAQIVQAMGGRMDVDSTPGQGSRFTIWLPAATSIT